jgi:hypothetical protein
MGMRTGAIVAVAIGILIFLFETSNQLDSLNAHVTALLVTTNQAMVNIRDAAASARDASEQARLAAAEQRAYWAKTSLETYKTMASLRLTIVRTDRSINDVLVPRISASLDASTALQVSAMRNLTDTTAKIDDTIDDLKPMIDNGIRATAAAATAMGDPAIHETLTHVDGAAGNLDGMSADGKKITADVAAFTHRELAPVRGTWNLIKGVLRDFAGPAAEVATSVK